MRELILLIARANFAGQPPQFVARPRPKTALDRLRARRGLERHEALVRRMLPHQPT